MHISVLRLDHRLPRDERITTHVALVARAFGAQAIIYTGQHDSGLEKSVLSAVQEWGGNFTISYETNYKKIIARYAKEGYLIVHLTMYGIPLKEIIASNGLRVEKLLIVVGGPHVPGELFSLADINVAITSQPHSEVAALAVFLNELQDSAPLERAYGKKFKGKKSIEPQERGKKIIEN